MTFKNNDSSIYRILDAAINRAAEGLRVVEDYLRMKLGDRYLSKQAKQLRHDLTSATSEIDSNLLIASRDAQTDVGRTNQTNAEYERESDSSLLLSNISRVKQSLRAIEEYGKMFSATFAQSVEQLRYDAYTLEKAIMTTTLSIQNLAGVHLCVLIDGRSDLTEFENLVRRLLDAGVGMLQLRDKNLNDRELLAAGRILTTLTKQSDTVWIMNDRPDIACAAAADGVHLGQDDMPVSDARRILGAGKLIGTSTHTIEQAREAVLNGANYIGVGPVFESQTKSFDQLAGLAFANQVASEIQLPAFAIGGVTRDNIDQIVGAGMNRVAVKGAVLESDDPYLSTRELVEMLG